MDFGIITECVGGLDMPGGTEKNHDSIPAEIRTIPLVRGDAV
jgi:hypothetical protein